MYSGVNLHHIQTEVLTKLANRSPLHFSDLHPKDISSNTFSYHLHKLIELGYIDHTDRDYFPTRKALKYIEGVSKKSIRQPPPTLISILYVINTDGRVLLLQRSNQPFAGWYGLPSGLVHQDESLQQAASRELYEKTGLVASPNDQPQFVGVLDFMYRQQDTHDIFVHAVGFVYKFLGVDPSQVVLDKKSRFGQLDWSGLTREKILAEVFSAQKLVDRSSLKKEPYSLESVEFQEPTD